SWRAAWSATVAVCLSSTRLDVGHLLFFFFSSRRRHTRFSRDWSSDVCSSDLLYPLWYKHVFAIDWFNLDYRDLYDICRFGSGVRSEERRVGKECRSRGAPEQ